MKVNKISKYMNSFQQKADKILKINKSSCLNEHDGNSSRIIVAGTDSSHVYIFFFFKRGHLFCHEQKKKMSRIKETSTVHL